MDIQRVNCCYSHSCTINKMFLRAPCLLFVFLTLASCMESIKEVSSDADSNSDVNISLHFRKISNHGLMGFNEGGIHYGFSRDECAQKCIDDNQCLSFDFDFKLDICYISHTTRYSHLGEFQYYADGDYYEWHGTATEAVLSPNGGLFTTNAVTVLTTISRGALIHYKIVANHENITTTSFTVDEEDGAVISGETVELPEFSCKVLTFVTKDGMNQSALSVSNTFHIHASKFGYFVPFYNGKHHGNIVRVALDVKGKKRPRPARFMEFSNFNSHLGIGAYDGQVVHLDLKRVKPQLKGFNGGFSALSSVEYYNISQSALFAKDGITYEVPVEGSIQIRDSWRVVMVLNATFAGESGNVDENTAVFSLNEEFAYFCPYHNGDGYSGFIARVLSKTMDGPNPIIQYLDVAQVHPSLKGFGGAFTDNSYGYFVPFKNEQGLTSKLVRVDLNNFTPSGVKILDLSQGSKSARGFKHGFIYENYAYLVPYQVNHDSWGDIIRRDAPVKFSGVVTRFNIQTFSDVEYLNLEQKLPELRGFSAGCTVGHHAYFVPFMNKESGVVSDYSTTSNIYASHLARIDLNHFTLDSVEYIDLSTSFEGLRGFSGGFSSGKYVVLVPYKSGFQQGDSSRVYSGHVVRLDTTQFKHIKHNITSGGLKYLDVAKAVRGQIPSNPDNDLRGFMGGFASGKYAYLVPYFNGAAFSGKICRVDIKGFEEVQLLDLSQVDGDLRGFYGGYGSKTDQSLEVSLFGEYNVLPGTKTPYKFEY